MLAATESGTTPADRRARECRHVADSPDLTMAHDDGVRYRTRKRAMRERRAAMRALFCWREC